MTKKDARKIMLWKGIERYRTAGGSEAHHAYKEALDNYIDDLLDVSEMDEVAIKYAHQQSFEQKYPRNPNSTCKCEHWQACIDCHPTYIESAMRSEV